MLHSKEFWKLFLAFQYLYCYYHFYTDLFLNYLNLSKLAFNFCMLWIYKSRIVVGSGSELSYVREQQVSFPALGSSPFSVLSFSVLALLVQRPITPFSFCFKQFYITTTCSFCLGSSFSDVKLNIFADISSFLSFTAGLMFCTWRETID